MKPHAVTVTRETTMGLPEAVGGTSVVLCAGQVHSPDVDSQAPTSLLAAPLPRGTLSLVPVWTCLTFRVKKRVKEQDDH